MHEMQSLQVQPTQLEDTSQKLKIDRVTKEIKLRLLNFLVKELKFLKCQTQQQMDVLEADLTKYCRNGVFFFDLVNRFGGRDTLIKGIDRSAKRVTQVASNF